jgi:hypothetical protein
VQKKWAVRLLLSVLLAISAQAAASASTAPGNTRASWAVQKSPNPSGNGDFQGVACTSLRDCVAVGSFYNQSADVPLAASWNGRAWRSQPVPAPAPPDDSYLNGVSCVKRTFCLAVGREDLPSDQSAALAEVWRGKRWRITPTPPLQPAAHASLEAVSCSSPTACTAVGYTDSAGQQPLIERWQGITWTVQPSPTPAGSRLSTLHGVSCAARTWCMSAGAYRTSSGRTLAFTQIWSGKRWSILPPKEIAESSSEFVGVSCSSRVNCTAAGTYGDFASKDYPLAERWDGKAWTVQPVPYPAGYIEYSLTAVACSTARACSAVGAYHSAAGRRYTFAESWNGRAWALQPTVNPSPSNNSLGGVACTSPTACTAAGGYAGDDDMSRSLIERYS